MADIQPFRGILYNQSAVKDMAAVICPPYDIITPQMQQQFYSKSEYNFVRLEHGRELPQDTSKDNKYTRSAATLKQWLSQGILKRDEHEAIYLHELGFSHQGKEYRRHSLLVDVRLEEWDKKVVYAHEGTLSEPKRDRVNMLWACQANTSPVLALFEDKAGNITSLVTTQKRQESLFSVSNLDGQSHRLWKITKPNTINKLRAGFTEQPLYIADGHHRYESALIYQRERCARDASASADAAYNFVMMALVAFSDPGLVILPPHRLVRGVSRSALGGLGEKLGTLFEIEELPLKTPDVWQKVDKLMAGTGPGVNSVRLVIFGLAGENLSVLTPRDFSAISGMMPYFHSEIYKRLDVSIIDHVILESLLGLDTVSQESVLTYSYDRVDAVKRVMDQEYQLTFILNPIRPEVIKAIADIGDRMPRKSTYFYPKEPAGLVLNLLE